MRVEVKGADLPGLKELRKRMAGLNEGVLVGVPAGGDDGGGHSRTTDQQNRYNLKRTRASSKIAARINRREMTRAKASARAKAERLFRAFTFADADEFRSGPIADAMRRNMRDAAANAKPRFTRSTSFVGKSASGSISLAMIAAVHEFGKPELGIPERSFLRGGIRRSLPKLKKLNELNLRAILLGGKTVDEALNQLGVVAAGEVKREFVTGTFVPLKQATKDRKGSSRPLIDSGQLRQSITYVVEGKQSAKARVI